MTEVLFTLTCFIITSILIVGLVTSIMCGYYVLTILFSIPFLLAGIFICFYIIEEANE